jgi:hypothetical protein
MDEDGFKKIKDLIGRNVEKLIKHMDNNGSQN